MINELTNNLNSEDIFTELFSVLKRYDLSTNSPTLVYSSDELTRINHHVENAMAILLQGLQGIGQLIAVSTYNKKLVAELEQIGFLISSISNLTEALNILKVDVDYVLRARGVATLSLI